MDPKEAWELEKGNGRTGNGLERAGSPARASRRRDGPAGEQLTELGESKGYRAHPPGWLRVVTAFRTPLKQPRGVTGELSSLARAGLDDGTGEAYLMLEQLKGRRRRNLSFGGE